MGRPRDCKRRPRRIWEKTPDEKRRRPQTARLSRRGVRALSGRLAEGLADRVAKRRHGPGRDLEASSANSFACVFAASNCRRTCSVCSSTTCDIVLAPAIARAKSNIASVEAFTASIAFRLNSAKSGTGGHKGPLHTGGRLFGGLPDAVGGSSRLAHSEFHGLGDNSPASIICSGNASAISKGSAGWERGRVSS